MAGIDSFTKLMLHLNGVDASTVITDDSLSPHTVTANGNAQIDTANSKFGGASGLFDGTGDYLSSPDHADWQVRPDTSSSGNFTIDFWVTFDTLSDTQGLVSQYVNPGNNWGIQWSQSLGKILMAATAGFDIRCDWTPSKDTWYHLAFVASSVAGRFIFVDGVSQSLTTDSNGVVSDLAAEIRIGYQQDANKYLDGHIDEFRISLDTARWTSNFTPPTSEYTENDASITLPLLSVQALGAAGADLTLPLLSVQALGAAGADLTLPIFTTDFQSLNHGYGSLTLPQFTITAVPPPSTITLPVFSVNAESANRSNSSINLPVITVQATRTFHAEGSISLPAFDTRFTGFSGTCENITVTFPALTFSIRTGLTTSNRLPQLSLTTVAYSGYIGGVDKSLPRMTVNVKATVQQNATFDVELPAFTLDNNLLTGNISLASTRNIPLFRMNAIGYVGLPGDSDIDFPALTLVSEGYQGLNVTVVQSLKMLVLDAYADNHVNRII